MPCLLLLILVLFPRVALVLMWISSNYLQHAFHDGLVLPVLGFIFLPLTTLTYAWAINTRGRKLDGLGLTFLTIAVLIDLTLLGWGEPRGVTHRLIRGTTTTDAPDFVEIGIAADGRVAQTLAINHAGEDETLKSLVGRRVNVQGKEEAIKDPSFALASLLEG